MCGVRGVAQQHDVAVVPGGVAYRAKAQPFGVVAQQSLTLQVRGEQRLQVLHACEVTAARRPHLVDRSMQACCTPRLLVRFHEERAGPVVEGVGVDREDAVLVLDKDEAERIVALRAAEPDELGAAHLFAEAELPRHALSHKAVGAVGAHEQVVIAELRHIRDIPAEAKVHANALCALLEDLEKTLSRDGGEAVSHRPQSLAAVPYLNGVPVHGGLGDGVGGLGIALREASHGAFGENHAKAEARVRGVALQHGHFVRRIGSLHQLGEIQARRPPANDPDLHHRPRIHSLIAVR